MLKYCYTTGLTMLVWGRMWKTLELWTSKLSQYLTYAPGFLAWLPTVVGYDQDAFLSSCAWFEMRVDSMSSCVRMCGPSVVEVFGKD